MSDAPQMAIKAKEDKVTETNKNPLLDWPELDTVKSFIYLKKVIISLINILFISQEIFIFEEKF